jgi:hypothetical protein
MLHERPPSRAHLVEVLERVLDKGIVIDAWLRLSIVGVSLITVEARVLVASIEAYLKHASVVHHRASLAAPVERSGAAIPATIPAPHVLPAQRPDLLNHSVKQSHQTWVTLAPASATSRRSGGDRAWPAPLRSRVKKARKSRRES